jgi:hypothetical protein
MVFIFLGSKASLFQQHSLLISLLAGEFVADHRAGGHEDEVRGAMIPQDSLLTI